MRLTLRLSGAGARRRRLPFTPARVTCAPSISASSCATTRSMTPPAVQPSGIAATVQNQAGKSAIQYKFATLPDSIAWHSNKCCDGLPPHHLVKMCMLHVGIAAKTLHLSLHRLHGRVPASPARQRTALRGEQPVRVQTPPGSARHADKLMRTGGRSRLESSVHGTVTGIVLCFVWDAHIVLCFVLGCQA